MTLGQRRGQKLGFPTANLDQVPTLIPADGVYAVRALVDDKAWPAAANIGPNPTFAEQARKLEVHLIGFTGDLYGQTTLRLDLVQRLRDTRPFGSAAELVAQLAAMSPRPGSPPRGSPDWHQPPGLTLRHELRFTLQYLSSFREVVPTKHGSGSREHSRCDGAPGFVRPRVPTSWQPGTPSVDVEVSHVLARRTQDYFRRRRRSAISCGGVGASAGGLDAFTELLEKLPANPGLATPVCFPPRPSPKEPPGGNP